MVLTFHRRSCKMVSQTGNMGEGEKMNSTAIRVAMVEQNVKMKDLETAVGISKTSLWRKLNGKTEFKESELKKLETFLHLSR